MRALPTVPFLLLGLVPCASLQAQGLRCPPPDSLAGVGAVVGRVLDAQTQVPLGYSQIRVRVSGVEARLEAKADPAGWFRLCSVPAGTFTISGQFSHLGAFLGPLSLDPGQTLSLSLALAPATTGRDTGTLMGTVVDADSGEPVDGAAVVLPGLGQTAVSNPLGKFTFPSLPPGTMAIHVTRLGYADADGEVEVQIGKIVSTEVALATEPIALEPIRVTAVRRRIELPGLEDFERRYNSGWGEFILEEEIQRRSPGKVTDLLSSAGVNVSGDGRAVRIRRTGCGPTVYLDGQKLTFLPRSGSMGAQTGWLRSPANPLEHSVGTPEEEAAAALNLVHPMHVVAIEVYRGPAETPGEYIDSNSRCGVILIWTRRGNIGRR